MSVAFHTTKGNSPASSGCGSAHCACRLTTSYREGPCCSAISVADDSSGWTMLSG